MPARVLGFDGGFVSLPLGIAAPVIAALVARDNLPYAIPALVTSAAYWILVLVYW